MVEDKRDDPKFLHMHNRLSETEETDMHTVYSYGHDAYAFLKEVFRHGTQKGAGEREHILYTESVGQA